MKYLACLAFLSACTANGPAGDHAAAIESAAAKELTAEQKWLAQLVGEWNCKAEAAMQPGEQAMKMESTESVRAIGTSWILAESSMEIGDEPFTALLTIGWDAERGGFAGTWVDTMQAHLWVYSGTLDASGKTLTLEAEGPSFDDPDKLARYRDAITVEGPDLKRMSSSVLGDDGQWFTFMTAEYRRR